MGADLYRPQFQANRDELMPALERAWKERNAAIEAWEKTKTKREVAAASCIFDLEDRPYPEPIRELCARADALYARIYGPPHYFRDSYNDSSLLWRLGLSWWALIEEAGYDCVIPDDASEDEYERIRAEHDARTHDAVNRAVLAAVSAPGNLDKLKAIEDDEWRAYFVEKYDRLCHFLQAAIDNDETICYSV